LPGLVNTSRFRLLELQVYLPTKRSSRPWTDLVAEDGEAVRSLAARRHERQAELPVGESANGDSMAAP